MEAKKIEGLAGSADRVRKRLIACGIKGAATADIPALARMAWNTGVKIGWTAGFQTGHSERMPSADENDKPKAGADPYGWKKVIAQINGRSQDAGRADGASGQMSSTARPWKEVFAQLGIGCR